MRPGCSFFSANIRNPTPAKFGTQLYRVTYYQDARPESLDRLIAFAFLQRLQSTEVFCSYSYRMKVFVVVLAVLNAFAAIPAISCERFQVQIISCSDYLPCCSLQA